VIDYEQKRHVKLHDQMPIYRKIQNTPNSENKIEVFEYLTALEED